VPNLALIANERWVQKPEFQNLLSCSISAVWSFLEDMRITIPDELWHLSTDYGSTFTRQIGPQSATMGQDRMLLLWRFCSSSVLLTVSGNIHQLTLRFGGTHCINNLSVSWLPHAVSYHCVHHE